MFRTSEARPIDVVDGQAYPWRINHMSSSLPWDEPYVIIMSLGRAIWTSLGVGVFHHQKISKVLALWNLLTIKSNKPPYLYFYFHRTYNLRTLFKLYFAKNFSILKHLSKLNFILRLTSRLVSSKKATLFAKITH